MGVKVEGVRADERVAVADTTARNRKFLIGGSIFVVVVIVLAVVVVEALKPTPTYGPVGHQFQIAFNGGATQAGAAQVGNFTPRPGVSNVVSWRYNSSAIDETVEEETIPPNDPFLEEGASATPLLLQQLTGSSQVTISGLPGVEALTTTSYNGLSTAFPYTETAVLLQQDTQYIITASGNSKASVQSFVQSFKTVG